MNVVKAEACGFCFGVKRAVDIAYNYAKKENIYTLGHLIHNDAVIKKLELLGVKCVDDISRIPLNATVIIRAHGVAKDVLEALKTKGIKYIDATCPKVIKIHNIVEENYQKGKQIIIFGHENHPETQGTNGWCEYSAIIVSDADNVYDLPRDKEICLVSQTTMSLEKWNALKEKIKQLSLNATIYDTICDTTQSRQQEAERIAGSVDIMIVVGEKTSSNTRQLLEVCKKSCNKAFLVENAEQLPIELLKQVKSVGVTTGASTPEWIIKEVISKMTEEKLLDNEVFTVNEPSFEEQLEQSMLSLYTGQVVEGTVIGVTPTEISVDLGFKSDGVVPADEISTNNNVKPSDVAKVGDKIKVFVVRVNDTEGTVKLSLRKLEQIEGSKKIEAAFNDRSLIHGVVTRVINGGLIVTSNDVRIFVPASHAGNTYIEDLNTLLNQEVDVRIIEINQRKRKIVGSIKLAANEKKNELQTEFWSNAIIGKRYKGKVKSFTSFGAFVDIGGVDGLVHISELSWDKLKTPSEILKIGDEIDVYIKGLDIENHKISLGYKNPEDNPWLKISENIKVGDVIKCKIVRLVPFGAFAQIAQNIDGLIHISQLDIKRVTNPSSVVSIGKEVEAKVISMDLANEKINLSMAALMPGYTAQEDEFIQSE
jgi:4-hydroxy-3-methylbut-2-enyl diphosphate reductase